MKLGTVIRTNRIEAHVPSSKPNLENKFGFKVPNRGDKFNFIFMGLQKKGEPQIDTEQFLRLMGWIPTNEFKRQAPYKDFKGNEIFEGNSIQHPSGEIGLVVFYHQQKGDSDSWRVDYGNGTPVSRLCLQIGDKGQAVVINHEA